MTLRFFSQNRSEISNGTKRTEVEDTFRNSTNNVYALQTESVLTSLQVTTSFSQFEHSTKLKG